MPKLNVDVRNLVYKLCEGREVPLLVTDIISGYLDHRDFFNITALSRGLNAQANAIIYRNVIVDLDGSKQSVRKASLLFRTLLTSETAAGAVRTLSLTGNPLEEWRKELRWKANGESVEGPLRGRMPPAILANLTGFSQREFQLYGKVATLCLASMCPPSREIFIGTLYLQLLRSELHVQDLSISSDYFRFPDFHDALQEMTLNSTIGELRSCSLCLDLLQPGYHYPSVVHDWDYALLSLFTVPDLQSITAFVCLRPEAVRQLQPGGSLITRLDLHHYQDQIFDLGSLLAATTHLTYLAYHAATDRGWLPSSWQNETSKREFCFEPLYKALDHVSDTLEELHLSQDFHEDSCHYQPGWGGGYEPAYLQKVDLSRLKRLHTLTIPYIPLVGWTHESHVYDWDKTLPSSLRRIILTDELTEIDSLDEWTDEELMPVFSGLVEWLSTTERGAATAEYILRLTNLHFEFNERVRQDLTQICEERGVRCSIYKTHADREKSPRRAWFPRGGWRGNSTGGHGRGRGT